VGRRTEDASEDLILRKRHFEETSEDNKRKE
jgi:hypothetical protein